jgi:hypothetical protein
MASRERYAGDFADARDFTQTGSPWNYLQPTMSSPGACPGRDF